jgi:hypothetical protein
LLAGDSSSERSAPSRPEVQPSPVVGSHSGLPAARWVSTHPPAAKTPYVNVPGSAFMSPVITAGASTSWWLCMNARVSTAWHSRIVAAPASRHTAGQLDAALQGPVALSDPEARCVDTTSTGPAG